MNEPIDALAADIGAAIDANVPARSKRPDLSPQQWEQMAQWIESRYLSAVQRAVDGERLVAEGKSGVHLLNQILFWRATAAVAKKLAYDCRVGKNGPWNLKTVRRRAKKS